MDEPIKVRIKSTPTNIPLDPTLVAILELEEALKPIIKFYDDLMWRHFISRIDPTVTLTDGEKAYYEAWVKHLIKTSAEQED